MTSEEINSIVKNIISICGSDSEDIESQLEHIIKEVDFNAYNAGYYEGYGCGNNEGYNDGYRYGYNDALYIN